MSLAGIVFSPSQERVIEYKGHKVVVRNLTTKDTIEMSLDFKSMTAESADETSIKAMLSNVVEILSSIIISIDEQKPDNREEAKNFLLNQSQNDVMELFKQANVFGVTGEEIKN